MTMVTASSSVPAETYEPRGALVLGQKHLIHIAPAPILTRLK
jgi:hypothetical protein